MPSITVPRRRSARIATLSSGRAWRALIVLTAAARCTQPADPTGAAPSSDVTSAAPTSNSTVSRADATATTAVSGTTGAPVATRSDGGETETSPAEPSASPSGGAASSGVSSSPDVGSSLDASLQSSDFVQTESAAPAPSTSDAGGSAATVEHTAWLTKDQTVRVMPFGDSITATGCWRETFLVKVASDGFKVDMVGSTKEKQCNETDVDNEGHSGKLITQEKTNVAGWATANPADVVLFHWGTNDVWKAAPISDDFVSEVLAAYTTAVEGLRGGNPEVVILVAQIIALDPADGTCAACPSNVQKLNAAIPNWAAGVNTSRSPVLVADLWTGFEPSVHTRDGAHPYTDQGVEHMAARWYAAFAALF